MKLSVITSQLPVLDECGNIKYYCGGVPRAMMGILSCIIDDYDITIYFVDRITNIYYSFKIQYLKFINKTIYTSYDEISAEILINGDLIFLIDDPTLLKWNRNPYQKRIITLFQSWETDPADCNAYIIANGTRNQKTYSSLLNIGCLYNSKSFYPLNIERENYALYVGRIDIDKNIKLLIDIWDVIYKKYNIKLKLIGPVNTAYITPINTECIEFITLPMGDVELNLEYNKCRMFVLPSTSESFCNVLIEAFACNTLSVGDGYIGAIANFNQLKPFFYGSSDGCKSKLLSNIINFLELNSNFTLEPSKIVNHLFSIEINKPKIKEFFKLCRDHPISLV